MQKKVIQIPAIVGVSQKYIRCSITGLADIYELEASNKQNALKRIVEYICCEIIAPLVRENSTILRTNEIPDGTDKDYYIYSELNVAIKIPTTGHVSNAGAYEKIDELKQKIEYICHQIIASHLSGNNTVFSATEIPKGKELDYYIHPVFNAAIKVPVADIQYSLIE